MKRVLVVLLMLGVLLTALCADDTSVDQSDIMLSDIPIQYGDEQFRARILERTKGERSPIGLVLSGGSARAMAHIGVLRYLEEQDIVPDFIISNSMGSIVGLLYSAGMSPDQIEQVVTNMNIGKVVDFTLPLEGGLLTADSLSSLAVSLLGENLRLENLDIPIIVVQEDLVTKRQVLVSEGDFATVFRSSFAIPVYFPAVEYQGHLLVDGGISNLAPIDIAYDYSNDIIVSTTFYARNDLNLRNPLTSLNVSFEIQKRRAGTTEIKRHPNMIWIRCQVEQNSFMDFDLAGEISQKGYEAAKSQSEELSKLPKTLGVASLSSRREALADSMDSGFRHYYLFDHVRQTGYKKSFSFACNSWLADDLSYLKSTSSFGMLYQGAWGNFTMSAMGGLNYSVANGKYSTASPAMMARIDYYAFNHLRLSVLADIDWDTAKAVPGVYARQSAEGRFHFFDEQLQLRLIESYEHLTAENQKRSFVGNTLLVNLGFDVSYKGKSEDKNWSLSGSKIAGSYQVFSNYEIPRQFFSCKLDVGMDKLPFDLFWSMKNTFRFALDGKGDVPLFFQDGYRTASSELRNIGHNFNGPLDEDFLIVSTVQFGYRPSHFKPSFAELVIFNKTSISAYLDMLFTRHHQDVSVGAQFDTTLSFLGLKDFPFTAYCGYDSAANNVVWGFLLSATIN